MGIRNFRRGYLFVEDDLSVMDNIETAVGMCRDLADCTPGLEVVNSGPVHLELTRPGIVAYLYPISDKSTTNISNSPALFNPVLELAEIDKKPVIPWLSPRQHQLSTYKATPDEPIVVSFVSGEYTGKRVEELSERNISAEQRLIIPLYDKVGEPLFHRLTSYYLAREGWLVASEHQYPIHTGTVPSDSPWTVRGTPDIVAWKSPFLQTLRNEGLIRNGATLQELAFLSTQNHSDLHERPESQSVVDTKTLVAEVKGSDRSPGDLDQVNKYIRSRFYDVAYGVIPHHSNKTSSAHGLITCDESGFQMIPDPIENDTGRQTSHAEEDEKEWFLDLMDGVAAQTLLCNLSYEELMSFVEGSRDWRPEQPYDLVENLWERPLSDVASEVATTLTEQ
ncbi:hypothetical protein [Haloplanus halophilus]|uniref:hypothetical protein n=1 Tax=Haloplanus halophilus TaxID=2949993 RepID=UPI00203E9946|nr:hypothetical protein [Haloplanus sp. GDY1]